MIQNRIIVSLAAVVVSHMICSINAFHTTLGISSSSSSSRRHTSTFSKSMNDHHHYNDRNTATRATKLNLSPWNNNNDNDDDESDSSKTKAFRVTLGKENNKEYLQSTIPKVFASVLATALSSVLLFSNISNQPSSYATAKPTVITVPSEEVQYYTPPQMTTTSSSNALQIAKTLKSLDSKMYGAYWCSHCYEQKQTLGKEAFQKGYITYIECDKEGYESQRSLCKERKVPGYPTWEIGGKLFPGEQSLEELGDIADEMKSALNAD